MASPTSPYSARQAIARALTTYHNALARRQAHEQAIHAERRADADQAARQREASLQQARAERDRQRANADQILSQTEAALRLMEAELKKAGLSAPAALAAPLQPMQPLKTANEPVKVGLQRAHSQVNTAQIEFDRALKNLAAVRQGFMVRLRKWLGLSA